MPKKRYGPGAAHASPSFVEDLSGRNRLDYVADFTGMRSPVAQPVFGVYGGPLAYRRSN